MTDGEKQGEAGFQKWYFTLRGKVVPAIARIEALPYTEFGSAQFFWLVSLPTFNRYSHFL